jgi:Calcineurin-like phosphoesterase
LLSLFRKRRTPASTARFSAPVEAGGPIYAIGDVHGRHDLLGRLIDQIFDDAADRGAYPKIVLLGDYLDRGEGSRETLDLVMALAETPDLETVCLMGNHEQMLLRFLRDPASGAEWLRHGGLQTLLSYGVGKPGDLRSTDHAARLRADLVAALGPHLGFIEGLAMSHRAGNVLFTHAGADPAVPPEEQDVQALLWGAERFLDTERADGVWVVHGHFVVDRPSAEGGRIAIDTGAYFSGRLTAARIADGTIRFIEG